MASIIILLRILYEETTHFFCMFEIKDTEVQVKMVT